MAITAPAAAIAITAADAAVAAAATTAVAADAAATTTATPPPAADLSLCPYYKSLPRALMGLGLFPCFPLRGTWREISVQKPLFSPEASFLKGFQETSGKQDRFCLLAAAQALPLHQRKRFAA